jgi:hypothetical protein
MMTVLVLLGIVFSVELVHDSEWIFDSFIDGSFAGQRLALSVRWP